MPAEKETFGRVFKDSLSLGFPIIWAINIGIYGFYKEMDSVFFLVQDKIEYFQYKLKLRFFNLALKKNGLYGKIKLE